MISLIPTIEEVNLNENNVNSSDGSLLNLSDDELKLKGLNLYQIIVIRRKLYMNLKSLEI